MKDNLEKGSKCLDIGSGSGYLTLAFSMMMNKPGAIAYGIEHISELVKFSKQNINKHHEDFLKSGKVVIVEGDGRFGLDSFKPYDCIHVGAGYLNHENFYYFWKLNYQFSFLWKNLASETIPRCLTDQLANGGRLVKKFLKNKFRNLNLGDSCWKTRISRVFVCRQR